MTIADLIVKITADTKAAESAVAGFGKKAEGGLKKAVIPAAAALAGLAIVGKVAFNNLEDGAKNAAQTNAVLKSTGDVSNVTAKHVDDLAMSLRRKAGVDDDVVHSGENMLLTFTNIRNETGKNNDIFDQATKVMLDMSVALGQDTKDSAIQLGKALNDPIRGVTALQRVGVTFTAQQRKQIKALVESGHTMAAQKLILHELNREFGGSATHIDPMQRSLANLRLDFVDLISSLIQGLLPAFQTFVGLLSKGTAFLTAHTTTAKVLGLTIFAVAATILVLNAAMKVYEAGVLVAKVATAAWTAAQWLLNAALDANPIGIVIVALAALVAAIVIAWTHSERFRQIVTEAWNAIKNVTLTVFNFIRDHLRTIMAALLIIFTGGLAAIVLLVISKWNAIKAFTIAAWNAIKASVNLIVGGILSVVQRGFGLLRGIVSTTMNAVHGVVGAEWAGIKDVVRTAVNVVETVVRTGFNKLGGFVRAAGGVIRGAVGGIVSTFQRIVSILGDIVGAAGSAASAIEHVVSLAGKVGGAIHSVTSHFPHFATGTSFAPGGLTLVGELGPELVNLPRGSSVFSNSESKRMLASAGNDHKAPIIGQVVVNNDTDVEVLAQRVARVLAFNS